MGTASTTAWWQEAFAAEYLAVYAHRDDASAVAEIAGLEPWLGRGPILDACCGNGRHLAALRRSGHTAVGFDWSADLLRAGRVPSATVRADVRAIPYAGGFSAVLVLFTAFGYFDEGDNLRALQSLAAQVAPGGRLLLDLPDATRLRAGLVAHSARTVAGIEVLEHRRLEGLRVLKDVHLRHADGRERRYTESVRLYEPEEIAGLAAQVGLSVEASWRSLRGPQLDDGRAVYWLRGSAAG
jgi:SAM-dependent methyltransferase